MRIWNSTLSKRILITPATLSHQDESNDLQHDTDSTSLTLTLGQIYIDPSLIWRWPFKVNVNMIRSAFAKEEQLLNIFLAAMFVRKSLAEIFKPRIQSMEPYPLTLGQIWGEYSNREFQDLSIFFFKLFLAIKVCLRELKHRRYALFNKIGFFHLNLFDLEDIDLWAAKLHAVDFFSQTPSHKNLVILTFIVAEMAGGGRILPPPFPGA